MKAIHQQRYTLLSPLGQGSNGKVFLAQDRSGKYVAIKQPLQGDLKHERSLLLHIHKNEPLSGVPRLLDTVVFPSHNKQMSLVLEYVEGECMRNVAVASLPLSSVIAAVTEAISILAHLHARGVVHYDLHNKNILMDKGGHIHILDFGHGQILDPSRTHWKFHSDLLSLIWLAESWINYLPQEVDSPLKYILAAWLNNTAHRLDEQVMPTENAISILPKWQEALHQATTQHTLS
jgi:serine/threonine protein kinase